MPISKTKKRVPRFKGGTKNSKNKTYKKVLNLMKKPNSYYAFSYENKNMWPSWNYNTAKQYLEKTPVNDINESKLLKLVEELEAVQLNKYSPN